MGVNVYLYTQHAKCTEFSRLYSRDVKISEKTLLRLAREAASSKYYTRRRSSGLVGNLHTC